MWRCKWAELQLRKLHYLGIKFDAELKKINQTKHLKYGNFALEGRCAKTVPFVHDCQREKPLKRKIRKSHEERCSQQNVITIFPACWLDPQMVLVWFSNFKNFL